MLSCGLMSPRILIHPLCAALLLLTGCQATLKTNDWSAYDGPGRAYFEKEEIELPFVGDPLEPMNRGIAEFNHGLVVWLASPTAGIYRLIFPKQIRSGIGNIFENLLYPLRLVTNLLQGKGGGAWRETKRFGVNTTIGIAGILDSATAMGIEPSREDFGQTFGRWGWRNSSYLMLPLLGPSTIRDGFGEIGNAAADPLTYFPPYSLIRGLNKLSGGVITYKQFVRSNFDPYQLGRRLFVMNRDLSIDDYEYSTESESSGETETLQSVFLTNQHEKFPWKGKTRKAKIPTTGRKIALYGVASGAPRAARLFHSGDWRPSPRRFGARRSRGDLSQWQLRRHDLESAEFRIHRIRVVRHISGVCTRSTRMTRTSPWMQLRRTSRSAFQGRLHRRATDWSVFLSGVCIHSSSRPMRTVRITT